MARGVGVNCVCVLLLLCAVRAPAFVDTGIFACIHVALSSAFPLID